MPDEALEPTDSRLYKARILDIAFAHLTSEEELILCDLEEAYGSRDTPCIFDFAHGKGIEGELPQVISSMSPVLVCIISPCLFNAKVSLAKDRRYFR
jgi:hypothetical protein